MYNAVLLLLALCASPAFAASGGAAVQSHRYPTPIVGHNNPVSPSDDSLWVKVESLPIGNPAQWWLGQKVDPSGRTIWMLDHSGTACRIQKRARTTGALVASFPCHAVENVYSLVRFRDSLCVAVWFPSHFDIYDTLGNFARSFNAPLGDTIRGVDWDGSKFWVSQINAKKIFTMTTTGTALRYLVNSGLPEPQWFGDITLDRQIPSRLWASNGLTVTNNIYYLQLDTVANTYHIASIFTLPNSGGGYPSGIGFYGPTSGGSYVYVINREEPWIWKIKVHAATSFRAMLVHSDDANASYVKAFADLLRDSSGGRFMVVDTYSIQTRAAFPATQWYNDDYRAILVYTNNAPADTVTSGDSLARFVELGGGAVDAIAAGVSPYGIAGRYRSAFSPFTMESTYSGAGNMSLVHNPGHPIMNGVAAVGYTGPYGSTSAHGNLRGPNSVCLAEWNGGNRSVAACFDSGGRRAAAIGMFPMWHWTGYPNTGQWVRLFVNALTWVANISGEATHDVGTARLLAPFGIIDSGTTVTPACSVFNYGTAPETYLVWMKIGSVYSQFAQVSGHNQGALAYVTFPTWVAGPVGTFAVSCSTELSGDANPNNDFRHDSVRVNQVSGAAERPQDLPSEVTLYAPSPNPFSGQTVVGYAVARNANVSLRLFDVTGKLVGTLAEGYHRAGRFSLALSRQRFPASGVYLLRLESEGISRTQKVIIE
jgi:hypothetical protein